MMSCTKERAGWPGGGAAFFSKTKKRVTAGRNSSLFACRLAFFGRAGALSLHAGALHHAPRLLARHAAPPRVAAGEGFGKKAWPTPTPPPAPQFSPLSHPVLLSFSTQTQNVNTAGLRLRLIDAKDAVIGRLAAQIATLLQGKDKPTYHPAKDEGDVVIVTNVAAAAFTGRKWDDKLYRWHTGYPGGLKGRTARDAAARDPTDPLRRAVYGMLPKNNLRAARARKLRLFAGPEHPFEGDPRLLPWTPPPRRLRVKEAAPDLPPGFAPLNPAAYARRFRVEVGEGAGDGTVVGKVES